MSKIQIKQITAHSSELGDLANGLTFKSVAQADSVIFSLIEIKSMGFAKTKLDVEFEDGHVENFDCDFCEGEGLTDSITYIARKYAPDAEYDVRYSFFQSAEKYAAQKQAVKEFNEKYDWGL